MALGHWLKDYLGPKASGEGGGESVELIKIGTVNGSGWQELGTNLNIYSFNGGASPIGETFGEGIGEKTIIAIVPDATGCFAYDLGNNTEPLTNQDAFKQANSMAVRGLSNSIPAENLHSFDIYAICI